MKGWLRFFWLLALSISLHVSAINLQVAEAPDDDLQLTVSTLKSAKKSILLNIYELTSPDIEAALLDRIRAGIRVEILQEGEVVGGFSAAAKSLQSHLLDAMRNQKGDRLFMMTKKAGGVRRFVVNHAKYAVIDGSRLLISSENYSPSGQPAPGKKGNRGWEVVVSDAKTAQIFTEVFNKDKDTSFKDLIELTATETAPVIPSSPTLGGSASALKPTPIPSRKDTLTADRIIPIFSPTTSLSGLENLIQSAKVSLDIEQMTFAENWGKTGRNSPLFEAVLGAARRGVKVRVLINDDSVFNHDAVSKNALTRNAFNAAASAEGLPLVARIANLNKMGVSIIHNKGVLVDDDKTLISSINWNENSVENNREAALIIESQSVHSHYIGLFEKDWKASE